MLILSCLSIFCESVVLLLHVAPVAFFFPSVNFTFSSNKHCKYEDIFFLLIIPESVINIISNPGFSLRNVGFL